MAEETAFRGFQKEGLAVLRGLEKDNSKDYFEAHRQAYEDGVLAPARAFVCALGTRLQDSVSPKITVSPKVDGSIFRLHRDTRFSPNKAPYKTNQALFLWEGKAKKASPGFYISLEPDVIVLGVGRMAFPDLQAWREAMADAKKGAAFERALKSAKKSLPKLEYPKPELKRTPKGFDAEHPRAEFLRMKHFNASVREKPPASIYDKRFVQWCAKRLEPMADLHRWLLKHT